MKFYRLSVAFILLVGIISLGNISKKENTTGNKMLPADIQAQVDRQNAGIAAATRLANSGGGGGGGAWPEDQAAQAAQQTQQQTYVDPYAQWGGQTAYNNLVSGFNNQKSGIYGSATDAARNLQGGYAQSIQDTIHSLQTGQQAIDRKATQNESSRIQGTQGVLGMVGRGIKSGGVMLANRNAGNSSAAQALANAYGQQGQRQLSQVGNQYAQNAGDIAVNQQEQDYQQSQAPNKFHQGLMDNVNSIVASAGDKLAQLDAARAQASLPDRLAIDQEKESVRQQVLGLLQQYDSQLAQGVGGIHAASRDQNLASASGLLQAGQADPNLFQYDTQTPAQFQNTGPFASGLPIFTTGKRKVA